jgi:hypothetical protein
MLLSVPMIVAGAVLIMVAWRRKTPMPVPTAAEGHP